MRSFGTQGTVHPERHYVVPRTEEISNFINRVEDGKYIVLFAPRQTGKTTFFRLALEALVAEDPTYFPIQLDFQTMRNAAPVTFYERLHYQINIQIESVFQKRDEVPSDTLAQFLANTQLTDGRCCTGFRSSEKPRTESRNRRIRWGSSSELRDSCHARTTLIRIKV